VLFLLFFPFLFVTASPQLPDLVFRNVLFTDVKDVEFSKQSTLYSEGCGFFICSSFWIVRGCRLLNLT